VIHSSLKMSLRLGGDLALEVIGVVGGERKYAAEAGDEDRKSDELEDDNGSVSRFATDLRGMVNLDNVRSDGGGVIRLVESSSLWWLFFMSMISESTDSDDDGGGRTI